MTTALNPPTNQIEIIDLSQYDIVPIATLLAPLIMMGLVSGITDPENFMATMEAFNKQAVLTVPVFRGEPGNPGNDAMALKFVSDGKTQPRELPTDLGDYNSDLGKFWVFPIYDLVTGDAIATTIYVWTGVEGGELSIYPGLGKGFVQLPVGTPGPDGAYADIEPQLALTQPNTGMGPYDTDSWIAVNDNAIQTISVDGTLTVGAFKLIARIGGVSVTSEAIDYTDITAGGLVAAIGAMSNVGADHVIVSGEEPYQVFFDATLDSEGIEPLVVTESTLVGGTVEIAVGDAADPTMAFYLAVPDGITGPACALGARYDVDFASTAPKPGDQLQLSTRTTPGPPTGLAASSASTNGLLHAGTYYYVVTAIAPNGETLPSNEVSVTITGSTNRVSLTWTVPSGHGATGFKVYRGPHAGGENTLVAVIGSGTRTSFIDDGSEGTSAALPPNAGMPVGDNIWVPLTPEPTYPLMYTVPQSAFHNAIGLAFGGSTTTIGAFALPPQPFPWVPIVTGELKVTGISLSLTPLQVAAEVLVGDATSGQMVAHGTGNSLGTLVMTSSYGASSYSPSFTNSYVPVPANHIGNAGTLFVKIIYTGLISLDIFNSAGAQLGVLVVPVED